MRRRSCMSFVRCLKPSFMSMFVPLIPQGGALDMHFGRPAGSVGNPTACSAWTWGFMLSSAVRCRRHWEVTIRINVAPGTSMNLRVTLLNQPKYWCYGGISPSTASQRHWRRLPHSRICTACFCIQSTLTFPLKSMAWSTVAMSTSWGISWIILNWQMTWSGVCISTRWKRTSDIVAIHTALPAMHHDGRSSKSASYGCHTTYSSLKRSTQHIRQLCLYFKVHQTYILFLNMLTCETRHLHTWLGNIEAICWRYLSLKMWAGLFFLFGTHNHLQQSRTRDQYLELSY